jgi:Rrf2 family protein
MALFLSRSCEYALQAVIYLATRFRKSPILQRDISSALNIPQQFLGKILQTLVRHDIVKSQRGKSGGFILSRSPKEFSLFDVVQVIDGLSFLNRCFLGFPGCSDDNPCPVHDKWIETKKDIIKLLKEKSIEELGKGIGKKLEFIKHNLGDSRLDRQHRS